MLIHSCVIVITSASSTLFILALLWQNFEVSKYNPNGSSTSKRVSCNNSLCANQNKCLASFHSCPYIVSYVSAETSTSGILVEDVLHLTTEDSNREYVEAYITFG